MTNRAGDGEDASCEDLDTRCANWVKRKGKGICGVKKYVKKKCIKSCGKCGGAKDAVAEKPEKKEVCEDKNENCAAWASRDGNLCQNHKFMKTKCRVTCRLCPTEGGVEGEIRIIK
jgi:hypothetical protein